MGDMQIRLEQAFVSGDYANRGYRFDEASQAIEFCVELDCQGERLKRRDDDLCTAHVDAAMWNPEPIHDSRRAVAEDVIAYKRGEIAENFPWAGLYADILRRGRRAPPCPWSFEAFVADPRYNGFSPYRLAWALYEGRGDFAGAYTIAIRGSVSTARPDVLDDFSFRPTRATHFLNTQASFAGIDAAEVHGGFAHGAFALLLDDRYGVLRVLHDLGIHRYARIYLTGHSRGAAIATLAHAFLHYAMLRPECARACGLEDSHYRLKSYAFGQPKPGNFEFAADFASITQRPDNALVINNHLDAVPRMPLTLQNPVDLVADPHGESWMQRCLLHLASVPGEVQLLFGRMAESFARRPQGGFGRIFNAAAVGAPGHETPGHSWNFQPAGHVMLVYGQPGDAADPFRPHRAWTYRQLIHEQLR